MSKKPDGKCKVCEGTGVVPKYRGYYIGLATKKCPKCKGTGEVKDEK